MPDHAYATETIESMLLSRVEQLARELAPQGKREGMEYKALNPVRPDRKIGSFSINLRTGKWADFADARGARELPCLGLIAYLATKDDFGRAILWAKDWLGISGRAPSAPERAKANAEAKAAAERRARADADREEKKRRAAHAIWLSGQELNGADAASLYLEARRITVTQLAGGLPGALRFSPRVRYYHEGDRYTEETAMVAAMHRAGAPEGFAAVHKTFLRRDAAGVWRKAFGKESKRILGPKSGATIRLCKGASGKPLSKAPDGEWIGISEGIENGLSAAIARPGLRVLAAGTIENVGKAVLPPQIGGVYVIADNDRFGSKAEAALERACNQLADRGIELAIVRAPEGFKDFNDALCNKPMEAA